MRRFSNRLYPIILVVVSLVFLGFAAHDTYVYFAGTPTTATMEQCTDRPHAVGRGGGMTVFTDRVFKAIFSPARGCTGTWSVGGQSYRGPIVGGDLLSYSQLPLPDVPVRVLGGGAYTHMTLEASLWGLGVFGLAVPTFAALVWVGRRRARSDRQIEP